MCSCRATPVGQLAGQAPEKPICGAVVVPSDGLEPSTPLYEDPSLDGIHPRIGCLSTQDDEGKFPGGSLCYLGHRPDEGATGRTLDPFLTVRGGPRLAAITVSRTRDRDSNLRWAT